MSDNLLAEILLKHHAKRSNSESPYSEYAYIVHAKDRVLSKFKPIFSEPANITADAFRQFLDFDENQHWTGLHRPTKYVCDDMPRLRTALTYLLDESLPIEDRLDAVTGDGQLSISGLSTGILTPILLCRYPDSYGVWNGKSESAMKACKLWPSFKRGSTTGQKYARLNDIFLGLKAKTALDLWTLDGLWHVLNEVSKTESNNAFRDLESTERDYFEGVAKPQSGFRVERNRKAREECLKQKGHDCAICGFNFFLRYGELGLNFIHVHHVEDLALEEGERKIDPKTGLVPVCPNCHAMLHKGVKKSRSLEDLRARLRDAT